MSIEQRISDLLSARKAVAAAAAESAKRLGEIDQAIVDAKNSCDHTLKLVGFEEEGSRAIFHEQIGWTNGRRRWRCQQCGMEVLEHGGTDSWGNFVTRWFEDEWQGLVNNYGERR